MGLLAFERDRLAAALPIRSHTECASMEQVMPNVTAITNNKPSAGSGARVSRSTGRACVQLPGERTLEARPHDGDGATPISGRLAADLVLGSGLFEQIAADMTRLDREIAAKPAQISFDEALAQFKGPIVSMKGWGL